MREQNMPLVLGVDLGGTKILTAVVDSQGKLLSRDHSVTPAARGPEAVIQAIVESAERSVTQAGMEASELAAVGIGAPGLSNPETGILFTSPNLPGWQDVPLRDIIEQRLGRKTFLINDANAAALGELYFGAAIGARNFVYVTISTGIGGGIVVDGQIYRGVTGTAGEVGHMTIADDGPLCNCGNKGCWEMLASGTALARYAKERIRQGASTTILDYTNGEIEKVTAETVQKAAQAGDNLANELILNTAYYIGVGLASLINIFNPELIVIGGGLSNMGDMLLEPAYEVAKGRAFGESYRAVRFVTALLGRNSGVLGVAAHAFREIGEAKSVTGSEK